MKMRKVDLKFSVAVSLFAVAFAGCATSGSKSHLANTTPMKCAAVSEAEKPVFLWSTPGFSAPESVVFDSAKNRFYVSNVAGSPLGKDGKGWISTVSSKGKILKEKWASGLNAPKGLGLRNGRLTVSDIDRVVTFKTSNAEKVNSVEIPGSKFLNDIYVTLSGDVLVSDMFTNRIYTTKDPSAFELFREGRDLENPNGITMNGSRLLVAAWGNDIQDDFTTPRMGRILAIDLKEKTVSPWSKSPLGNLDGIEVEDENTAIVSDWMAGKVYRMGRNGGCTLLLEGFKGSADLTFIPKTRTLVIPLMGEDRVVAYHLPKRLVPSRTRE
jgi:hypothetical protein